MKTIRVRGSLASASADWLIALSVIVCSMILASALFVAIEGNPFKRAGKCAAVFPDGQGLTRNSPVFFAGVRVGTVTKVDIGGAGAEPHVIVEMDIENMTDYPATVEAQVESASLLGDRRVTLVIPAGASAADARLAPGARIRGRQSESQLGNFLGRENMARVEEFLSNATAVSSNLKEQLTVVAGVDPGGSNNLMTSVWEFSRRLKDPKLDEIFSSVHAVSTNLPQFTQNLGEMLTNLTAVSAEVRDTVSPTNATGVALSQRVRELASRMDTVMAKVDSAVTELRVSLVLAQYFSEKIAREPHRIVFGKGGSDTTKPSKDAVVGVVRNRTNSVDGAAFHQIDRAETNTGTRKAVR